MTLNERLRNLRKSKRLTLLQVSESTELSVSFLSDIERGAKPSLDTLEKLAVFYSVSISELLDNEEITQKQTSYPPGLKELLNEEKIDDSKIQFLLTAKNRSKKNITSKKEWQMLYNNLAMVLGWE